MLIAKTLNIKVDDLFELETGDDPTNSEELTLKVSWANFFYLILCLDD